MKEDVSEFMTIDQIRFMLRKRLGLRVGRGAIYNYIKTRNFPNNIGIGRPRLWRTSEVVDWINGF